MSWNDYKLEDDFVSSGRSRKKNAIDELTGKSKKKSKGGKKDLKDHKKSARHSDKKSDKKKNKKKDAGKIKDRDYSKESGSGSMDRFGIRDFDVKRQKVLNLITDPVYVPMKAKEIALLLSVPKHDKDDLKIILGSLMDDGKIRKNTDGKYVHVDDEETEGVFVSNPRGFGFVTADGYDQDFFISPDRVHGAFHKDTVRIRIFPARSDDKRREAEITEVIAHEIKDLVGTYEKTGSFGFVTPDDRKISSDIFIPEGKDLGASDGDKVVVTIEEYGSDGRRPEGIIIENLGAKDSPYTDILSIIRSYGIPEEFPQEVLDEAEKVSSSGVKDIKGRLDLRDQKIITIDGDDSKDLDDAVSLRRDGDAYILGVHIADVSEYVTEKSPLDKEALKRGTSVYLPDRVIPMLPKALSNGICSLNEGEDRLTLSVIMRLDAWGHVTDHKITESVIRSAHRMTYHEVKLIVEDKDEEMRERFKDVKDMLDEMLILSRKIRALRHERGSIDFNFEETKIILDENGVAVDIKPYEHSKANEIIEDFMILANETVAEHFCRKNVPFLYRSHDIPDHDKIHDLGTFIEQFGLTLHPAGKEISPKDIQRLLEKIEGTPEEGLIMRLALRSMQQAKYTVDCIGHFGLAARFYCHFTSPIRRYPDLIIHRIIKEFLHGRLDEKRQGHFSSILPAVATETSKLERREDEVEREADKMKKAEYMKKHIGEVYDGVISGVTGWGFYVELPNTIEGLVHVSTLTDDYYHFNELTYQLVGERLGHSFTMGQPVRVRVSAADKETRTVDFVLDHGDEDEK